MKKASEYRDHARECRVLAATMDGAHRDQILEMAGIWEKLAYDRAGLVGRHPELARPGEHENEHEAAD